MTAVEGIVDSTRVMADPAEALAAMSMAVVMCGRALGLTDDAIRRGIEVSLKHHAMWRERDKTNAEGGDA
jgi:hypothetical protein